MEYLVERIKCLAREKFGLIETFFYLSFSGTKKGNWIDGAKYNQNVNPNGCFNANGEHDDRCRSNTNRCMKERKCIHEVLILQFYNSNEILLKNL